MSKLAVKIEPLHTDQVLNAATQRGLKTTNSPDLLAIFSGNTRDATKNKILDALGGEQVEKPDFGYSLDAYLIRSDRETFFTLCDLFDINAVDDVPVQAHLNHEFRRFEVDGVPLATQNLVVVGVQPEVSLT